VIEPLLKDLNSLYSGPPFTYSSLLSCLTAVDAAMIMSINSLQD